MERLALAACLLLLAGCAQRPADVFVPLSSFNLTNAHETGSANASVLIVEYSDFECPFCGLAQASLKRAVADYQTEVKLVFKHYPLNGECNPAIGGVGHAQACDAALASECAGEQGKFWEFHDRLFQKNVDAQRTFSAPDFTNQSLLAIGQEAGADAQAMAACMRLGKAAENVVADAQEGRAVGVEGTPTFFVNGKKIEGMLSYSEWKDEIENAKKRQAGAG